LKDFDFGDSGVTEMDQLELAPSISSISMVPVVFDSIDPPSKLMSEPTTASSVKPKLHLVILISVHQMKMPIMDYSSFSRRYLAIST